jgi:hypothetical protein
MNRQQHGLISFFWFVLHLLLGVQQSHNHQSFWQFSTSALLHSVALSSSTHIAANVLAG